MTKAIIIEGLTPDYTKPRLGQAKFKLKGYGNYSVISYIKFYTSGSVNAYIEGDAIFTDANGVAWSGGGKTRSISNGNFVYFKMTGSEAYLFVKDKTKLLRLGDNTSGFVASDMTNKANAGAIEVDVAELPQSVTYARFAFNGRTSSMFRGNVGNLKPFFEYIYCEAGMNALEGHINDLITPLMTTISLYSGSNIHGELTNKSELLTSITLHGFSGITGGFTADNLPNLRTLSLRECNNVAGDVKGFTQLKTFDVANTQLSCVLDEDLPTDINYIYSFNDIRINIKDIGKLPNAQTIYVYKLGTVQAAYSTRKTFPSTMNTVSLGQYYLSTTDIDNLLIDLAKVEVWTGSKVILLMGVRSETSDSAIATLQSKGVTVTINI